MAAEGGEEGESHCTSSSQLDPMSIIDPVVIGLWVCNPGHY